MKLNILLALSLGLNLLFGGLYLFKSRPALQDIEIAPATVVETPPVVAPAPAKAAPMPITTRREARLDWRHVESRDYKEYINNLRGIGCPEETIRDIIVADVDKLFEARRKGLAGSTNRFQFWKGGNPMAGVMSEERIKQQQDLAREKRELLQTLLGPDFEPKPEPMMAVLNPYEAVLDFLPASRQAELIDLETRFAARLMTAQKAGGKANQEEVRKVQAEKQAELARLLTSEEKEEYDLRTSQTANNMRNQLSGFEPTEQEFREIFKLRKALDDQLSAGPQPTTPEERQNRTAAQKDVDEQIKALLGEGRYADYKYSQEWAKSTLQQIAEEHNIPKQTAYKVFDLKSAAQEQVRKTRQDQALSPDQRQVLLRGVRVETERAVAELLGAPAAQDYISKGNWIRSLSPDPVPPKRAEVAH